jgi:purine-nucleoside phosphorylase
MPLTNPDKEFKRLQEAARFLKRRFNEAPKVGLILGSGLSNALGRLNSEKRIKFGSVPHFPKPTVAGHAGEYVYGYLEGQWVLIQRGRVHYYEGYEMHEVAFSIRVMKLVGIETVIITNASGGINETYSVGDFVLIKDHINLIPDNPLLGKNIDQLGPRFPNLLDAYSQKLRRSAKQAATRVGLDIKEGIYCALPGPMYESPAEIQAYKKLGADLVGMSTVPEVIAGKHCGLSLLGISVVTNIAAGLDPSTQLTHEEVLKTMKQREKEFARLIHTIMHEL